MIVRAPSPSDREALARLLGGIAEFTPSEVACALELVDLALETPERPGDYRLLVVEEGGKLLGYLCYGPTPMTDRTFDLYWVATGPEARGRGVGAALVGAMEARLRDAGGRLVRVETSSQESYGGTRAFYLKKGYVEAARIADFYKEGDDLVVFAKRLGG